MASRLSDSLDYRGVHQLGNLPNQFCDSAALQVAKMNPQLSDQEYARALRRFIACCVDVLFYYLDDAGKPVVFLPLRAHKPQPGRWVVGGQRTPFLTVESAACEKVGIETGLHIEPDRFEGVPGEFDYMWAESEHGQGLHARAALLACELTAEEQAEIALNGEYNCEPNDCWFPLDEALNEAYNIHPALRAMLCAFQGRNSNMVHQHSDDRRSIYEAVHKLDGGLVTRVTVITVTGDKVPLGNHYHPHDEQFKVQAGRGLLVLAPADDLTCITEREFEAGESILVPADTAHTFVCDRGTVLVALTDWEFTEGSILPAKLV